MIIELTLEETGRLLNKEGIRKEVGVLGDDGKRQQIILSIRRISGYPLGRKRREEMTEAELHVARAVVREGAKKAQRRTLANIGKEDHGRTHKRWTCEDKRELMERIKRGETGTQIALTMGRTQRSVDGARRKFRDP